MKKFKDLKKEVREICVKNNACKDEYKRILDSKNKKEMLQVIKDNVSWCYYNAKGLISVDMLDNYGTSLCEKLGIYYKGEVEKIKDKSTLVFLGNFKVKMLGNSTVTEMWGNSMVRKFYGNTPIEIGGNCCVVNLKTKEVFVGSELKIITKTKIR